MIAQLLAPSGQNQMKGIRSAGWDLSDNNITCSNI
jgi:hypothetical protein